jgi:hypothetical protein
VQPNGQDTLKGPVVREEVQVGKRLVETGSAVRIHKTVAGLPCRIDEEQGIVSTRREEHHAETVMLASEQVSVERFDEAGDRPHE